MGSLKPHSKRKSIRLKTYSDFKVFHWGRWYVHSLWFIYHPSHLKKHSVQERNYTHCCNMYFQYTLLADIFNSSSQLILKELTFFCNLFPFLQEVLGGSLHRCCQHMSLLGASLLLVRWAFVAGVYQSGDLYHGYKIVQQQRDFIWTLDEFGRLQLCQ